GHALFRADGLGGEARRREKLGGGSTARNLDRAGRVVEVEYVGKGGNAVRVILRHRDDELVRREQVRIGGHHLRRHGVRQRGFIRRREHVGLRPFLGLGHERGGTVRDRRRDGDLRMFLAELREEVIEGLLQRRRGENRELLAALLLLAGLLLPAGHFGAPACARGESEQRERAGKRRQVGLGPHGAS